MIIIINKKRKRKKKKIKKDKNKADQYLKKKSLYIITNDYNYLLRLLYNKLIKKNIHYQTLIMKKLYNNIC